MRKNMSKLKIGDKVVMHDRYYVDEHSIRKVFTVRSEPWMCCGTEVVLLEGMTGGYATDGLTKIRDFIAEDGT